jgi:hypothetical protein
VVEEARQRRLEATTHHEPIRDATAAGTASEKQAVVIVKGVDALTVEHPRKAETPDRSGQAARSSIGARDGVSRAGAANYHGLLV